MSSSVGNEMPISSPDLSVITGGPSLPQVRRLVTAIPGPKSIELGARRAAAVARGAASSTMPVFAAAGGGGVIVDVDGNSLIDLASGIAVTTVGISAPAVVKAIQAQAARLTHTCFMTTPYESYVALAEQIGSHYPGQVSGGVKAAFFNSGAEAVENTVKIARAYTGRQAVVVFDHAFHGRTNLTMSMTAKVKPYKGGFGPFAGEIYRVAGSYPYRDGLGGPEAAKRAIAQIESQIGAAAVAAVVIEPIQGEGGFIVPAPGYLAALADWCHANGIVFVADEVQSGIGRTGSFFAIEHEGVTPDLISVAKGMGGGMPISGVVGRAEVMDGPGPGGIGGTYCGNPVACASALAVLQTIESDHLLDRAQAIGAVIAEEFATWTPSDPRIGDVRGRGAMIAIEVVKPGTTEPDPATTSAVAKYCHDRGVILLNCGTWGNVLRFLPPLAIGDDLLREGLGVVAEGFAAVRS